MKKVKAREGFAHDALRVDRGEVFEVSDVLAHELQARGLIEAEDSTERDEKAAAEHANKMAAEPQNKATGRRHG